MLHRAQLAIDDDQFNVPRGDQPLEFLDLAAPEQGRRFGLGQGDKLGAGDIEGNRLGQADGFREPRIRRPPRAAIPAAYDRMQNQGSPPLLVADQKVRAGKKISRRFLRPLRDRKAE